MITGVNIRATRFSAACLLVGAVVAGEAQPVSTLKPLTLPSEALPGDCALKQPTRSSPEEETTSGRVQIHSVEWSPFPTNPWSGTDRKLVAEVRKAIDGTPRLPDGPPLERGAAAAFLLKLADNVVEAYRAIDSYIRSLK